MDPPGAPPSAGIHLPSAPSAPSAPPNDDKPKSIYPSINDQFSSGRPGFPSFPTPGALPGTTPSMYPGSPAGMSPNPGFRPPPPGGFPPTQNIGPYPTSPNPNPNMGPTGNAYPPRSPAPGGYPQQAPGGYPQEAPSGYPSAYPGYAGYPQYPGHPGNPGNRENQNYGNNYQGGGGGGGNNAPVPTGYYVYKPKDFVQDHNRSSSGDSSTMDKVKKYGLPIIGAGVATYALSKLTDGFGMGGHSSDSD